MYVKFCENMTGKVQVHIRVAFKEFFLLLLCIRIEYNSGFGNVLDVEKSQTLLVSKSLQGLVGRLSVRVVEGFSVILYHLMQKAEPVLIDLTPNSFRLRLKYQWLKLSFAFGDDHKVN